MSYQEIKHKRLIHIQIITDTEVYLGMLEFYLKVRKQKS